MTQKWRFLPEPSNSALLTVKRWVASTMDLYDPRASLGRYQRLLECLTGRVSEVHGREDRSRRSRLPRGASLPRVQVDDSQLVQASPQDVLRVVVVVGEEDVTLELVVVVVLRELGVAAPEAVHVDLWRNSSFVKILTANYL